MGKLTIAIALALVGVLAFVGRDRARSSSTVSCAACGASRTATRICGVPVGAWLDQPDYERWVKRVAPAHVVHEWQAHTQASSGWGGRSIAIDSITQPTELPALHALFGENPRVQALVLQSIADFERHGAVGSDTRRGMLAMWSKGVGWP
ncbi:MAG: hypothetical protein EPO68_12325 [Planctomycetota bacterium]|nr:MAG: hypothetical protein EPO68_12325 [Planctomycetota bacterium]